MVRSEEPIYRSLRALRTHLGMDVAFVGEFSHGTRIFRYVDSAAQPCAVTEGTADPLEETYCGAVIDGRLPGFLSDPATHPVAAAMPATLELPVGTHLSVPITLSDGSLYGTFCCFSFRVQTALDERDLAAVTMMAAMVAGYLDDQRRIEQRQRERREQLHRILAGEAPQTLLQPIVHMPTGALIGAEALARFPAAGHDPVPVFADAWAYGLGEAMELKAAAAALHALPRVPSHTYLAINVSPATMGSVSFHRLLSTVDGQRIVVEVTEHAAVHDYDRWLASARSLAGFGVRLAVDDVGTGFSGLHHILQVRPDILKIDRALVHDVDRDAAKRAMVRAVVSMAPEIGALVVAEGVETDAEAVCLAQLGVADAQGFHFGRPGDPLVDAPPVRLD